MTDNVGSGPLVTVLTPAYNEAGYLAECMESVLAQTHQNWEFVVVDNCSKDKTREIAEGFARRDARIRVVSPPAHVRQVDNFNFAVSQISPHSRYCKFVQGDDLIFPGCLAQMVTLAESNPSVGVVSSYRLNGCEVLNHGLPLSTTVIPGREVCRRQLLDGIFVFGTPTSLMFRSEILRGRNPCFPEASLHFDTELCYDVLDRWDFGFVHQVLCFCRTQEGAITARIQQFNPDSIDYLICLNRYGRRYLDAAEFDRKWCESEELFYEDLGRIGLNRRDKTFWQYQRDGLKLAGSSLNRARLTKHMLFALLQHVGNPERTLRRLLAGKR